VPIGRVTSIDPDAVVLTTGTVSLRRFDKRPGETLVLAELLDRRVTLLATGEQVTVLDLAMEQQRTGDWLVQRIARAQGRRVRAAQPPPRRGAAGRLGRGQRLLAVGERAGRGEPARRCSRSCARPTSPASCTTCPASAGRRSPPPSTTSASPTCSRR
jgi:hypothetical protein